MTTPDKSKLFKKLFHTFQTGIRSPRAEKPKAWLEQKGLNYETLQVGFNSGQFHHRKSEVFKQDYVNIGVLQQSDAAVKSSDLKAYTCFGDYGIIFPLKNEQNNIVNLYAVRIDLAKEKASYLNQEGIYPNYPHPLTKTLYITENILDAATLLESRILDNRDAVMALSDGELRPQCIQAIQQLAYIEHIILVQYHLAAHPINAHFPATSLKTIQLPKGHSLNDMFVNYGVEGILKLLQETSTSTKDTQQAKQTCALNRNSEPLQESFRFELPHAEATTLVVYNEQKIGFQGLAGSYYILGTQSHDLANLKITLQLEEPATKKRHTRKLDLFENDHIEHYCRELSEKEGFNPNQLQADLLQLSGLLSAHRDQQVQNTATTLAGSREKATLSPEKEKQAIQILSSPNLIQNIDKQIAQSGVIGEESNRMLLFIAASTFKSNPLHVLVQGSSGSGKSHLINAIKDCLPAEDVINLTRVTSKSFYHYQGNDLMNKAIIIQDFDGLDEDAQLAFREAQSAKYLSSSTVNKDRYGNLQSHVKHVNTHFSSMIATTKAEIYYDNSSRSVVIGVDEGEEQTRRIIHYQNQKIAGIIDQEQEQQAKELLQNCIRVLKPYKVINRYADKINLPVEAKMLRRLNEQFQLFVIQVAFFHQYQRQIDEQGRIIATPADIQMATELFFDAIWLKVDELDSSTRQFFERLKEHVKKQSTSTDQRFTQRDIRQALNQSKSQCFRYFDELQRLEYIAVVDGSANRGFQYKVTEWKPMQELKGKIKKELSVQVKALT